MGRHNRDARGSDQRGFDYQISFQPDWLSQVKVTRNLESGRQSTKTLFKNPEKVQEQPPGSKVRTRIVSPEQKLDFEIIVHDPRRVVKRVIIETIIPDMPGDEGAVVFGFDDDLPSGPTPAPAS
jgi:hypothetical protein